MSFYHVCFAVPDLDAAMGDLTAAAGVAWQQPAAGELDGCPYRIVFSAGGPPFLELIEAQPGGPWGDTRAPRFHHLGFWTADVAAGGARLAASGFPEEFSGCPFGRPFAYHRVDSVGAHVELVDASLQPSFLTAWGTPDTPPMPVLGEQPQQGL